MLAPADFEDDFGRIGINPCARFADWGGILRAQQIQCKLVFGKQHPRAAFFTGGERGNIARKLPFGQFGLQQGQALRPKFGKLHNGGSGRLQTARIIPQIYVKPGRGKRVIHRPFRLPERLILIDKTA